MSVTSTIDLDALLQGIPETRRLKRFTRDDCEFLERLGKLPDRYELLEGQIILVMSQKHFHAFAVAQVFAWLISVFGVIRVRTQTTLAVDDFNMPEPDLFVLSEDLSFGDTYPNAGETVFVAEVSDSTLRDDLRVKAPLYARAGIPEYWVIDIRGRQLFFHADPKDGVYQSVRAVGETGVVSAPGKSDANISVAQLLPPADNND